MCASDLLYRITVASRLELLQFDGDLSNDPGRTASEKANGSHWSTARLASTIPTTPLRLRTMHATKTSPVIVHRVRPTPARPRRIVPEDISDPVNPRFSLVKEYSSPPIHPSQKRISRIAAGRLQSNTKPRVKEAGSIEKVGFVTSNEGHDTELAD